MIKNIVFDMGKVLVGYDENRVCRQFMEDGESYKRVRAAVFHSQEWVLLDMGVISEEEGLRRMKSHLESEKEKQLAEECYHHWHEFCMWTIKEADTLVKDLKDAGYGIYLCSNAPLRLRTCYQDYLPAAECFDGILFSAEEKLLKPQKEIYERLFEKFGLKREECFFIDDQPINIEGAAACGMKGFCHRDENIANLREALKRGGIRA